MDRKTFKVCVCASGGGGNFQSLIDSQSKYNFEITKLITDRDCYAISRASKNHIPYVLLNKKVLGSNFFDSFEKEVPECTDLIVLAGFLQIIPKRLCEKWTNKIINTHPSLLPKYGGKDMYGTKVHEMVIKNKEEFTGCTIHFVNEKIDGGEIILQKKIRVSIKETPYELGGRVFEEEKKLLPLAVEHIIKSQIKPRKDK